MPVENKKDPADVYISRLGLPTMKGVLLSSQVGLPSPTSTIFATEGLPTVVVLSYSRCYDAWKCYLEAFQSDKLEGEGSFYNFKTHEKQICQLLSKYLDEYGDSFSIEVSDEYLRLLDYLALYFHKGYLEIKDCKLVKKDEIEEKDGSLRIHVNLGDAGKKRVRQQTKKFLDTTPHNLKWENKVQVGDWEVNLDAPQAKYKGCYLFFKTDCKQYRLLKFLLMNHTKKILSPDIWDVFEYLGYSTKESTFKKSEINLRGVVGALETKVRNLFIKQKISTTIDFHIHIDQFSVRLEKKKG